jgi:hypothetical protein
MAKAYRRRMGESGSPRQREPGDHDDGDLIQFGGLPVRWSFLRINLPRLPQNQPPVKIALATLAIGLLIGFFGGRLTAHQAREKARSGGPVSTPVITPQLATTAIGLTGARCAVQLGPNLQLGIEIMNETHGPVTLGAINPMFPLGGLRSIASGVGTCGALPVAEIPAPDSLSPGETEWIHITVAVRKACPEPLPVWFRVGYDSAGRPAEAVLAGFPDLGSVRFKRCAPFDSSSSAASFVYVDLASDRSYRG